MTAAEKNILSKMTNKYGNKKKEVGHAVPETRPQVAKADKNEGGFLDVAGMDELKSFITAGYINPLRHAALAAKYGIAIPNILLWGPKGCGKTYIGEKIAEEIGIKLLKVVPDDIASTYVHGTQMKIKEVFDKAAKQAPCILLIDEFESMCAARTANDRNNSNGDVNEFLVQLAQSGAKGVHVILATNHPDYIDDSVLRTGRVENKIYIPLPDEATREGIFRIELSRRPSAEGIDCAYLASISNGYNCSDIASIVNRASCHAFNKTISNEDERMELITQESLEEVIAHMSPSVTKKQLMVYERIRKDFCDKDEDVPQMRIGFQ